MTDYLLKYGLEPHACKTIAVGDKIGRIEILATGKLPGGGYKYMAVYRCECGSERSVHVKSIQSGDTKSCGCWIAEKSRRHGLWGDHLFIVWKHMMERCYDSTKPKFRDYGARGILVCERWQNVLHFYADMKPAYKRGLTLDRIDNNGPYAPDNCRWATPAQQSRNKRNNIFITINGETLVLKDWCSKLGVNYGTAHYRIKEMGMDPEAALSTSVRRSLAASG